MAFWTSFFRKKTDSPDILGAYPENMQVRAIPERRYLKTSRLLALFVILNVAVLIALSGLFVYYANRVDVSIAGANSLYLFAIDHEQKILKPSEYYRKNVHSLQLMTEAIVRDYIIQRHAVLWDDDEMRRRWNSPQSFVLNYSTPRLFNDFRKGEALQFLNESRSNNVTKDVHLYDLKLLKNNLWHGIFEVFDMPIPDAYRAICPCDDNSETCLSCKRQHAIKRHRYQVYLRTRMDSEPTKANPLGITIYEYHLLYMPIHDDEKVWDIPSLLRPVF